MFAACSLSKLQTAPSLRSLVLFGSKSPSIDRFSQILLCKAAESARDFSLSAAAISGAPPILDWQAGLLSASSLSPVLLGSQLLLQ